MHALAITYNFLCKVVFRTTVTTPAWLPKWAGGYGAACGAWIRTSNGSMTGCPMNTKGSSNRSIILLSLGIRRGSLMTASGCPNSALLGIFYRISISAYCLCWFPRYTFSSCSGSWSILSITFLILTGISLSCISKASIIKIAPVLAFGIIISPSPTMFGYYAACSGCTSSAYYGFSSIRISISSAGRGFYCCSSGWFYYAKSCVISISSSFYYYLSFSILSFSRLCNRAGPAGLPLALLTGTSMLISACSSYCSSGSSGSLTPFCSRIFFIAFLVILGSLCIISIAVSLLSISRSST